MEDTGFGGRGKDHSVLVSFTAKLVTSGEESGGGERGATTFPSAQSELFWVFCEKVLTYI